MILLIFTVSTEDHRSHLQHYRGAAGAGQSCWPHTSPRAAQCPGVLSAQCCQAVRHPMPSLEGRCGLHFLQDFILFEVLSLLLGTSVAEVCAPLCGPVRSVLPWVWGGPALRPGGSPPPLP